MAALVLSLEFSAKALFSSFAFLSAKSPLSAIDLAYSLASSALFAASSAVPFVISPIAGIALFNKEATSTPKVIVSSVFDSAKKPRVGPSTELTKDSPSCAISPKAAPILTKASGFTSSAYSWNFLVPCSSISFKKA